MTFGSLKCLFPDRFSFGLQPDLRYVDFSQSWGERIGNERRGGRGRIISPSYFNAKEKMLIIQLANLWRDTFNQEPALKHTMRGLGGQLGKSEAVAKELTFMQWCLGRQEWNYEGFLCIV